MTSAREGSTPQLAHDQIFLSKEVLSQHMEACFVHIYHVPSYNFLRLVMLDDLYNDNIPPVLSKAICEIVSSYLSRSYRWKIYTFTL